MGVSSNAKIAVLMGGLSREREVSLVSGAECANALERLGYDAHRVDVSADIAQKLSELKPDVVFNALHGTPGEDGTVQGLLELMQIPYTHSGVLASSLAMDKERTKTMYRAVGLPVGKSVIATKKEIMAGGVMKTPYVVKPYNEGSSVGIYIVRDEAQMPEISTDMPEELMVEEYLEGRELTTAVMGDRALCVTDILTDGWYDFDAKYKEGGSRHVVPADLPEEITAACLDYALRAHQVLGCRGMTRTDFRWNEALGIDGLYLLETNTQPGMTPTSLAPEQAGYMGIEFDALIKWMIEDASCSR